MDHKHARVLVGMIRIMSDVTRMLFQIDNGDPEAAAKLLPLVYEELRKLAAARMANERSDLTLQATALVHDAYIRLVDVKKVQRWDSRGHFFSAAAEAMRRILIERARRQGVKKRHGQEVRVDLDDDVASLPNSFDILVFDDALTELGNHDDQAAELVRLRFFAGLTHQEAADSMGISRRVADRLWTIARAWLSREMSRD